MTVLAIAGGFEMDVFLRTLRLTGETHEPTAMIQVEVPLVGAVGGKVYGWVEREAIAAALPERLA